MVNKLSGYKSYINGCYRMMVTDLFGVLVLGFKNKIVRDEMAEIKKKEGYYVVIWTVENSLAASDLEA